MPDPRVQQAYAAAVQHCRAELARGVSHRDAARAALDQFEDAIAEIPGDWDAEYNELDIELHRIGREPQRPTPSPTSTRRKEDRPQLPEDLLTSPFRFVALNETVVPAEPAVCEGGLDRPLRGGYCGVIEVEWAAETPLLIGTPQFEYRQGRSAPEQITGPMQLGRNGPWVIPGSTIRGCLRAALEIVASARLGQINAHHRYGLRDFDHPRIRDTVNGKEVSRLAREQVHAGWLRRRAGPRSKGDSDFEIVPCARWHTIAIADLPFRSASDEYQWRHEWLGKPVIDRYRMAGVPIEEGAICFDRAHRREFAQLSPGEVGELVPRDGGGVFGTLVFSNRSPSAPSPERIREQEAARAQGQAKKREYVFIDLPADQQQPVAVSQEAWDQFELINSKPARNRRVPDGSWQALQPSLTRDGGRLPVFYTLSPDGSDARERLEFGLTRFFKIAHDHSVGDMRDRLPAHRPQRVRDRQDLPMPDFVEALFGYVHHAEDVFTADVLDADPTIRTSDVARKGRIACEFATLLTPSTEVEAGPVRDTVLSGPRASFAPFYLQGEIKDYSALGATLAGRKRYFPRFVPGTPQLREAERMIDASLRAQLTERARDNTDIVSRLRLLKPRRPGQEMVFSGRLRLHNVSAAEVGGLLWVLTHGGDPAKPYRHMMGHAKTVGAGQMRVRALRLQLVANDTEGESRLTQPQGWEQADAAQEREGWVSGGYSLAPFLRAFHDYMRQPSHRPNWPNLSDIAELLAAADPARGAAAAAAGRTRYPLLENRDKPREERNEFNILRARSKLSNRYNPPKAERRRYLPALSDVDVDGRQPDMVLPYLAR